MYLTLDIGNTRSKFARFDERGMLVDEGYGEALEDFKGIEAVVLANVTNKPAEIEGLHCPVVMMNHRLKLPFTVGYKTPETLGADRLAAVVGAAYLAPDADFMVVDAGTCLKFEYLHDNNYLGGSIAPGLMMRYKALSAFTERLPEIEHRDFEPRLGDTTETAILSGVQQGFLLDVEGRIRQYLNQNPSGKVFLTGGDSAFLAERLKTKIFAEPLLLHYGLYHTLRLNGY
jgi:type III pantothenate kinase